MGAPSVAVQEFGVNIGGSIANADTGVCSVSDEEGVPLAASLDVDILFAWWWKARTNLAAPVVD